MPRNYTKHKKKKFLDESNQLVSLKSQIIAPDEVVQTVRKIKLVGRKQYTHYVRDRLISNTISVQALIQRNKLALFGNMSHKPSISKGKQHLNAIKNDCSLFSRLYIASQTRDGDIDEFFCHENQSYPPSLCQASQMRQCTKSDLITCLDKEHNTKINNQPNVSCVIIDGAAAVQMINPGIRKTFAEYANQAFKPFIFMYLEKADRIDVVFDVYRADSLKTETRIKRGTGIRLRIFHQTGKIF